MLKNTTWCHQWGMNARPLDSESDSQMLYHYATVRPKNRCAYEVQRNSFITRSNLRPENAVGRGKEPALSQLYKLLTGSKQTYNNPFKKITMTRSSSKMPIHVKMLSLSNHSKANRIYMSRNVRKPDFAVSDQVRHKPACIVTESKLEAVNFRVKKRRYCTIRVTKTNAQISCAVTVTASHCTADLHLCFRIGNNPVFLPCGSYDQNLSE